MTMQHDGPRSAEGDGEPLVTPSPAPPEPLRPTGPRPPSFEAIAKWSIAGLLIAAIMALCFGFGFGTRMATEGDRAASSSGAAARAAGNPDFNVLNEIYGDIKKDYVDSGSLNGNAVREGAIDGLIKAVGDPHMAYLSEASLLGEADDTTGSFSGIGATVQQKNGSLTLTPLPNTPAEKSGIKPDDMLLSVDGVSANGWNEFEAVRKIRGPRGSKVKLGIKHASGAQEDVTIQRDTINLDSVHTVDLHDADGKPVTDVGYVKIDQFTLRTPQELQKYLQGIQGKNYKGLVIDLRNNPGGVVDSVVSVASQFVGKEPVLVVQQKDGSQQTLRGTSNAIVGSMPLAVLVNHNSASASEILSGALRDDRQAKLIGETTFGKGTENILVPLKSDPGAIYISVARWLTPSKVSIEGTGLKPDIAATAADNEDPNGQFNAVLYRAISYIQTGN